MTKTLQQTIPFGLERLYNDALYLHLIHKGYTPKQAEKEVIIRANAKMREINGSKLYVEKLKEELQILPDDSIILIETTPEKAFELGLALVKFFSDKKDSGIIVSANRPYSNLINVFAKKFIDIKKMFILDCVSKSQNADFQADNVSFIDNASALTDISLSINQRIRETNGLKKFVFFDSIPVMIIHNKSHVFARFIHSILTMMRLNGVSGILISFDDGNNREIRAEIAQLCDKVIKI